MTIRLFLNLLLNLILQKTTKPNLPQSFPKSFPTFSYNILLHSLTKVYLCLFTYSHTIFPQYTNFPYNPIHTHLYTLCTHTHTYLIHLYTHFSTPTRFQIYTHYSHPTLLYTHLPTHQDSPYPIISKTLTQSLFLTHINSHTHHLLSIPSHVFNLNHSFQTKTISTIQSPFSSKQSIFLRNILS
jgi:hypothetical protein